MKFYLFKNQDCEFESGNQSRLEYNHYICVPDDLTPTKDNNRFELEQFQFVKEGLQPQEQG